jgi:Fe-S-cluster containining protein
MLQYSELVRETDRMVTQLARRYHRHVLCRAGCSPCCRHDLSVFAVEAEAVRRALSALPEATCAVLSRQAEAEPASCPLLVDDRCAIYDARPLICRTQGLPLLIEADDGRQEVDFCPLNFAEAGAMKDLDQGHLVILEDLNSKLVHANRGYCLREGMEPDAAGLRWRMSEIVRTMRWIR